MSLAEIQRILPREMTEDKVRQVYSDLVAQMGTTATLFIDRVDEVAKQVLTPENDYGCENLVLHSAVSSVLYKLLTAKLTALQILPEEKKE